MHSGYLVVTGTAAAGRPLTSSQLIIRYPLRRLRESHDRPDSSERTPMPAHTADPDPGSEKKGPPPHHHHNRKILSQIIMGFIGLKEIRLRKKRFKGNGVIATVLKNPTFSSPRGGHLRDNDGRHTGMAKGSWGGRDCANRKADISEGGCGTRASLNDPHDPPISPIPPF